jgi:hypothetical protein
MDFTLKTYKLLLQTLKNKGYTFITFHDYPNLNLNLNLIILRHDVDLKPQNSLATAKIEHEMGIKGSYYFRAVPESWDETIIREIAAMGHEVGYHYETMDTASRKDCFVVPPRNDGMKNNNELIDAAYHQFCENLEVFRQIADVKTICMHGSPRSKYDNRDIWKKYSYKELGIIGEPYFDINFDNMFYLTDTGRRWDGHRVSIRDKMPQQEQWEQDGLSFRSTKDIIKAASQEHLPHQIMITVHPQRWSNSFVSWAKGFVLQNLKNVVKRMIVRRKQ